MNEPREGSSILLWVGIAALGVVVLLLGAGAVAMLFVFKRSSAVSLAPASASMPAEDPSVEHFPLFVPVSDAGLAARRDADAEADLETLLHALSDDAGLSDLRSLHGAANPADQGSPAPTPTGPTVAGEVNIGAITVSTPITGAERVVAALRFRFRQCYRKGLEAVPSMEGSLVLEGKIDATGDVPEVTPKEVKGLSAGVPACVARALSRASFDALSTGTSATIKVPLKFIIPVP